MTKIIGIDLGTSNSAAAVLEGGRPKIVPSAEGASLYGKAFPSVVAITKDGQVLVGEPAKRQAVSNPAGTIKAAKRKMGTSHKYKINNKEYTPQQISAFILQKIKKDAESFLGEKISKAVITVPAYFDDNQRQATKDAGTIAGLDVVRIINEPTAAALSYGLDKNHEDHTVLVFDLGGGTLDVTIMNFGDGVFEVKSTSGDTNLGGTDMDNSLIDYLLNIFKSKTGIDLKNDEAAMQRLREASEKAKIELSTVLETEINLPYLTATDKGPQHLQEKITRAKLEELIMGIVEKCHKSVTQALNDSSIKKIDKIIMVGGPTRIPLVQKKVEEWVGQSVERGVDPMECVATGAAIQGGVLSGDVKDVLLLDVTPLSLGIETLGGVFTKLIERNTTIPVKKSQVFSTASDNQEAVTIRVGQGERSMFNDNKELGRFDLIGIPTAPRGIPKIEVSFDIDANGILHVTAKDLGTKKEQSIRITAPNKLDDTEVERMKKEAEEFAESDKKRMEDVQIINDADSLIFATEKSIKEMESKVDKKLVDDVKEKLESLKKEMAKKDRDISKVKQLNEELIKVSGAAATELYKKAQEEQKAKTENTKKNDSKESTKKKEETVDAEVVEKDTDKETEKK